MTAGRLDDVGVHWAVTAGNAGTTPQLLVSVRSLPEARAAQAGGCDIIDIKEPRRGPLGRPDPSCVLAIVAGIAESIHGPSAPVLSCALGEASEQHVHHAGWNQVFSRLAFVKLGTAGLVDDSALHRSQWHEPWLAARQSWMTATGGHPNTPRWIVVAYADHESARGPTPEAVISAACSLPCAGVLIDTWSKQGGSLFEIADSHQIQRWIEAARKHGLLIGLAGRLQPHQLSDWELMPDLVGIRSAACRGGNRDQAVEEDRVRAFRVALRGATTKSRTPR